MARKSCQTFRSRTLASHFCVDLTRDRVAELGLAGTMGGLEVAAETSIGHRRKLCSCRVCLGFTAESSGSIASAEVIGELWKGRGEQTR